MSGSCAIRLFMSLVMGPVLDQKKSHQPLAGGIWPGLVLSGRVDG
jgi:hypothetical protein